MMSYDQHIGTYRKFGAVKLAKLAMKMKACTVSISCKHFLFQTFFSIINITLQLKFIEQEPHVFFLVIDSPEEEKSIHCEHIEEFEETELKDGVLALQIVFYIIQGNQFARKSYLFQCCENEMLIKTMQGIHKQLTDVFGANYIKDSIDAVAPKSKKMGSGDQQIEDSPDGKGSSMIKRSFTAFKDKAGNIKDKSQMKLRNKFTHVV